MKSLVIIIALCLIPGYGRAQAGIPKHLTLSGTGEVRYLGFIKVYDAALYAPPDTAEEDILSPNVSRCFTLEYAVSLSVADFIKAADTVLAKQHDAETLLKVKPELDRLHQSYRDVGKEDSYTLCYEAATQQTTLSLNATPLVTITSVDLATIYFGIWLGPRQPLDDALRSRLLTGLGTGKES